MVRSMYAAIAGLKTHQSKMDVIGNNISNCNTYGYKSSRATFQEAMYTTTSHASGGTDSFGGTNSAQVGYGCSLASIDKLFETSTPAATGKASDCMIVGQGFFLVGNKLGEDIKGVNPKQGAAEDGEQLDISSLKLTRVGAFDKDEDGYIVDRSGYVVYGFSYPEGTKFPLPDGAAIDKTNLVPLKVPEVKSDTQGNGGLNGEEGEVPKVSISIDNTGVVTAKMPSGETFALGIIAVANVPNPGALEADVNSYYNIGNNTGVVEAFQPGDGNTGKLQTACLEMANVDIANEFAEMITTQRGFQANTRIITVTDQMLEELVNMKR
ncbi:MAG: flagellar hook-basal body complex protein [Firmicutes bacterium]|nr:flagellar hook-basal body complex protein [Bacillota bacterium]